MNKKIILLLSILVIILISGCAKTEIKSQTDSSIEEKDTPITITPSDTVIEDDAIDGPTAGSVGGPLDTARAEVTILSVDNDKAKIRIEEIRDYRRYPWRDQTYPRLNVGDEIEVSVYDIGIRREVDAPDPELIVGKKYLADMWMCYSEIIGGLTCDYEGWSVAIYLLEPSPPPIEPEPEQESDIPPPPSIVPEKN